MKFKYINEKIIFLGSFVFILMTINIASLFPLHFLLIGLLQYHLVLILHECIHETFFDTKDRNHFWGNIIGSIVFISYKNYQNEHRDHHLKTGTIDDPDFYIYQNNNSLNIRNFLFHFLIGGMKEAIKKQRSKGVFSEKRIKNQIFIIIIQTVIFYSLYYLTNNIFSYFFLWCFPLFFVAFYINRLRINFEHGFGKFNRLGNNIKSPLIIELIIFAYNFNYHYTHHKLPQLEAWKLPDIAFQNSHPEYSLVEIVKQAKAMDRIS